MEWTKQRLGELLPGAEAASSTASEAAPAGWVVRVTRVKSVNGEVGAPSQGCRAWWVLAG